MSSDAASNGISRSAARLRWLVFTAMGVFVAVFLLARFHVQIPGVRVEYQNQGLNLRAAEIIGDVSMILLVISLSFLTVMLRRIAGGELFTSAVVRSFRRFALWLLILALFQLLAPPLLGLASSGPGAPHQLHLLLDMRNILTVGITLLLFLLARLLERARVIDDEMREIV